MLLGFPLWRECNPPLRRLVLASCILTSSGNPVVLYWLRSLLHQYLGDRIEKNMKTINLLGHTGVEEPRGQRSCCESRELSVRGAQVLQWNPELLLPTPLQHAFLGFYCSVCAEMLSANCFYSNCCNLEKGVLLRHQCVYCTIITRGFFYRWD